MRFSPSFKSLYTWALLDRKDDRTPDVTALNVSFYQAAEIDTLGESLPFRQPGSKLHKVE